MPLASISLNTCLDLSSTELVDTHHDVLKLVFDHHCPEYEMIQYDSPQYYAS